MPALGLPRMATRTPLRTSSARVPAPPSPISQMHLPRHTLSRTQRTDARTRTQNCTRAPTDTGNNALHPHVNTHQRRHTRTHMHAHSHSHTHHRHRYTSALADTDTLTHTRALRHAQNHTRAHERTQAHGGREGQTDRQTDRREDTEGGTAAGPPVQQGHLLLSSQKWAARRKGARGSKEPALLLRQERRCNASQNGMNYYSTPLDHLVNFTRHHSAHGCSGRRQLSEHFRYDSLNQS